MNRMHGIIFAYEQRGELRELTERRTAASMPFGGRYRAVDFALSNLLNAGVTDVGMVLHGRYQSMLDHVGSGKVWDMSRKRGGLHLLPPFNYLHEWGVTPFRGKMEALAGVRDYLNEIRQDYVVLMEGDLVANLPLADILEQHIRTHADITAVCGDDSFATENGTYFEKDPDGHIREVLINMHRPRGYRSLDVFILSCCVLWWTSARQETSTASAGMFCRLSRICCICRAIPSAALPRRSAPCRSTTTALCSFWISRSGRTSLRRTGLSGPRVPIRRPHTSDLTACA